MHRPLRALALLAVIVPAAVHALDWPRWRGPGNDGHLPAGSPLPASLPAELPTLWSVPAGEGLASPVVAANRVFAFDNQDDRETLRALDAATGRELWRAAIDVPFTDTQGPRGPRNTPLVDGDRVYAVSCRGELRCLRTADGALVWRANYVTNFGAVFIGEQGAATGATRHGNDGSPLIDGPHLIAQAGGTNDAGTVCLDKRTGDVVWKSTRDPAGYATPVLATFQDEPQVVIFNALGVVGLRRGDGLERWRFPVKTSFGRHVTAPVVHGDTVVVSSHQAGLMGLRIRRDGDTWSATSAWNNKPNAINYSCPVADAGNLYGLGAGPSLVCVEIATGRIAWSQTGIFSGPSEKAYGGFLVRGDRVLGLTDTGELFLFANRAEGFQGFGRTQVCGMNWCNPACADGVVYLRDGLKKDGHWKAIRLSPAPTDPAPPLP